MPRHSGATLHAISDGLWRPTACCMLAIALRIASFTTGKLITKRESRPMAPALPPRASSRSPAASFCERDQTWDNGSAAEDWYARLLNGACFGGSGRAMLRRCPKRSVMTNHVVLSKNKKNLRPGDRASAGEFLNYLQYRVDARHGASRALLSRSARPPECRRRRTTRSQAVRCVARVAPPILRARAPLLNPHVRRAFSAAQKKAGGGGGKAKKKKWSKGKVKEKLQNWCSSTRPPTTK